MSYGLDRKVALKNSVLFLILSTLLKIIYFFLILSNYRNTRVTFNLPMRKSSIEKIIRLMLEEVIILDGHMSDGQMY